MAKVVKLCWRTKDAKTTLWLVAVRTCRVTCIDPRGVEHTIQVSAQSLYEAVAQAQRIFREDDWCEDLWQSAARLVVKISRPAVEHRVRIKDFTNWLESAGKSPTEMALKSRLRDIVSK